MKLVYIHGATASERSFAFISEHVKGEAIYLNYDRFSSAAENLNLMTKRLTNETEDLYYITHSLGGIYAVYLQDRISYSVGAISLATPFNGSEIASWGRLMNPGYALFADIAPTSKFVAKSREINIRTPWTQVVTTVGDVPWLTGPNDGIVTRASMTCRNDVDYVEVDRNHYEIVQSQRVVDLINTHITQGEK